MGEEKILFGVIPTSSSSGLVLMKVPFLFSFPRNWIPERFCKLSAEDFLSVIQEKKMNLPVICFLSFFCVYQSMTVL